MQKFPALLSLLLFFQSCSVYYSGSLTVDEAVAADNKVKVVTEDNQKYKFRELQKNDDQLTGITKPNSATAEKIAGMPAEIEGKFLKVDISELVIEEIKLRNNTLSTILNIGIPVVTAFVGFMTIALISFGNSDWEGMDLDF